MASVTSNSSVPGPPGLLSRSVSGVGGAFSRYRQSGMHSTGKTWAMGELGFEKNKAGKWGQAQGLLGKWAGRAFIGYSAYQGFKEGGVGGAAMGVGTHMATTYAFGAAWGAVKTGAAALAASPALPIVAGVAAIAGATAYSYRRELMRPYVNAHMKKHAKLEMGTAPLDPYGNVSTMRQRSLQAINNSHLNGRVALGNEANIMYTPYFMR